MNKKAITLVELLVVLSLIAIMLIVTLPAIMNAYKDSKENIIQQYNESKVVCIYEEEIIYEGNSNDMPDFKDKYTLDNVEYHDGVVYMYFIPK